MCGGKIQIKDGSTVAECEYCGTIQTLPKFNDERRLNLLEKASRLRRNYEFDKASQIYEKILNEEENDCEIYWSLVLCRYGIEYVEDSKSHKRVPTVHRAQFTSIFDDVNYKSAINLADAYQKAIYEEEANKINEIQKNILTISDNEDPFDVFICYKETDEDGKRTIDSVLATELYYLLKQEGFNVFFSRITLEDKLGVAYEPYIFAALNSAKIMVVVGTKEEYFNAVWVKNEWSRFLSLIKSGKKKMLIPAYRDMDAYQLPKEFSHLQAQDMSKLGFMQDLIRGIKKIIGKNEASTITEKVIIKEEVPDIAPLLRRAYLFLEDSEFNNANEYAEKILDLCPEFAEAYIVKLLVELRLKSIKELLSCNTPINKFSNYQKALRFATPEYKEEIIGYNDAILKAIEDRKSEQIYNLGVLKMNSRNYDEAIQTFTEIINYKDSRQNIEDCKKLKEARKLEKFYNQGIHALNTHSYDVAIGIFKSIIEYKDSKEKLEKSIKLKEDFQKANIYFNAIERVNNYYADDVALMKIIEKSIDELKSISGYKDADKKVVELTNRLERIKENKRKAEEEARIKHERQQEIKRILSKKLKSFGKLFVKFGIPVVSAVTVILLLVFLLIVPLSNYNYAEKQFEVGNYDEAKSYYEKSNGFYDSKKRLSFIKGYGYFNKGYYITGINEILKADVPVRVVYHTNGGQLSNQSIDDEIFEYTYSVDSEFTGFQAFEKSGYHFIKWEVESSIYKDNVFAITLNSVWGENDYSISYDLDGGSVESENLTYYGISDDSFTLVNPIKTGYTFVGWIGTDFDTPTVNVTIEKGSVGDRSYKAVWKANTYTLYFESEDYNNSIVVTYGQKYSMPILSRTGYTFSCWKSNGVVFGGGEWCYAHDVTVEAEWVGNKYTATFENMANNKTNVTVTFKNNYNEGDTKDVILTNSQKLEIPQNPTRAGHVFTGWYTDSACTSRYDFSGTITQDMTLYAGWTPKNDLNVYSDSLLDASKYNSESSNFKVSTSNTNASNRKYIYLVANESGEHRIYYKTGYSSFDYSAFIGIKNLTTGETIRSFTTFYSSTYNSSSFNCNEGDVIEICVYKYYYDSYVNFYFSNFNNQTSTAMVSCSTQDGFSYSEGSKHVETFTYGEYYKLPEMSNGDYYVAGWYNENKKIDNEGVWSFASNLTLKPLWKEKEYTITLNANGGDVEFDSLSVKYGKEYVLPTPTKKGYTFDGWYLNNGKYESGIWSIKMNVELVAKWLPNEYTVTFSNVEHTANYVTITYDYNYAGSTPDTCKLRNGEMLEYPPIPTREDYAFVGWYTDISCTISYPFNGTITEDITLYAYWIKTNLSGISDVYVDISNYSSSSSRMTVYTSAPSKYEQNCYYFSCYKTGTYELNVKNLTGDFYVFARNISNNELVLMTTNLYNGKAVSTTFKANAGDVIYLYFYNYGEATSLSSGEFYVLNGEYPVSTAVANVSNEEILLYKENSSYSTTIHYNEEYTFITPTRSGYKFLGWYVGETKIESGNWEFFNDLVLTAKWEKI